jgi:hypothetical protein
MNRKATWIASLVVAISITAGASAQIDIENIRSGDTVHHPVVLLIGAAEGVRIDVVNRSNPREDGKNNAPIQHGRFKVLVELVPGGNDIELTSRQERTLLRLTYKPSENDRLVNIVYVTADDGDTRYITQDDGAAQDYVGRLDTMAKLLQTATAEMMFRRGHGRKTFKLDLDANGRVVIHEIRLPLTREQLQTKNDHQLYDLIKKPVFEKFPPSKNNTIAIMSFSGYDPTNKKPLAHAALGGRGLGIFSCNGMENWPMSIRDVQRAFTDTTPVDVTRVWDDSVGRSVKWGLASTTMGAVLHEAGHALGMPHPEYSNRDIMSRGFDHLNRWFIAEEAVSGRNKEPLKVTEDMLTHWHVDHAQRFSTHPWFRTEPLSDAAFLRTWRILESPRPWTSKPNAPQLSGDDFEQIVKELRNRPTVDSITPDTHFMSLTLTGRYSQRYDVVTYAMTKFDCDAPLAATLLAGGDDGMRIWLNGKLVLDQSGVEATDIDRFAVPVELNAGENVLVVESQQGPGDWGFSLRLTDRDGRELTVSPENKLIRK